MKDPLRALLIDDNPDDRALVIRELAKSFPGLVAEQVGEKEKLTEYLETASFDLVITDYQLCWSDGLSILNRIKTRWPECPVIMFTGTGSEEIAVKAMKAGLDDYVLKSARHFAQLPTVVKSVLNMARHKKQLRQAELRYSTLFASVPVGLYRATLQGRILDANPSFHQMLGFEDSQKIVGKNLADLHLDSEDYRRWHSTLLRDGLVQNFETRLRTRDGKKRWVENSARAVAEASNSRMFIEGSVEDVEQRKLAEVEREKLIAELREALSKVNTLSGLLPICAACKKIRDDKGYWNQIEAFIQSHSDAEFTHSFCPDCMHSLYPEVFQSSAETGS